jgi:predicted dithiol-disulfide oxidoreductase (DUF899 family)
MTQIATREDWTKARLALLAKEKELTRLRDEVAASRRALPRVRVDKDYVFDTPQGKQKLADLFEGKSQLIVYHFMFGPDATDPCKICSFWAEHYDSIRVHLPRRDANLICVSRAALAKIEQVRARMGWKFPWVSSGGGDFNADFGVTFTAEQEGQKLYNFGTQQAPKGGGEHPGASVFIKEDGKVFHTYSCYARGLDALNGTYQWLDLLPKGRDETALPWPAAWVKFKHQYQEG